MLSSAFSGDEVWCSSARREVDTVGGVAIDGVVGVGGTSFVISSSYFSLIVGLWE